MLLAEVVTTSAAVGATRSRRAKTTALADLLRAALSPALAGLVVALLIGVPRQGKIGVGWRLLSDLEVPPAPEPGLSLSDVDDYLQRVSEVAGKGSTERRKGLLTELFARATEAEQRFLFRLLVGELRQGALEGVMVDAVAAAYEVPAEAVRRALMLSGDLVATAVTARAEGEPGLGAFRLRLGRPVRPMLAAPADSLDTAIADQGSSSVEYKLDGARIQVHRDGDEVHVYTRTLREITASVPELVELVRALPCRSVVLDGETLALTDDGRPRPFQETMSRFGAADPRELLLRPYFFDVLHLDGVDLLDAPLRERLAALEKVAGAHRIPSTVDPTADEASALLDAALAAGHEGVMVKALDSGYAAGRRGRAWQKVKPVHTLDLVVLAAEWGHGRRTGFLSNLHLGARDPDGGPPIMVGKTFKGLTDELLAWQTKEFQEREVSRDSYTVHLRPELVVEIELDGAQVSPRYPGGVALRFARVLRYRPDKDPADADTIDAVRALLVGA
ncbi:ATP-dependent DNA ligase [Allokutzneria sp. A3M-2-11 16]|uniref:ATP-dependent DNA ligase n=1 Tax=Allokutzneria sp. A3M-2-11 16 TaxID=2962043 RepID=UPI0020B80D77|nr:ATP-dependent DNA ligase [Allokutzneria sp. A3M-2-11 16]MCP3798678.1 ATP-dependent DNA ligase [Allokutzneria sp. A3M-2-11 16]